MFSGENMRRRFPCATYFSRPPLWDDHQGAPRLLAFVAFDAVDDVKPLLWATALRYYYQATALGHYYQATTAQEQSSSIQKGHTAVDKSSNAVG